MRIPKNASGKRIEQIVKEDTSFYTIHQAIIHRNTKLSTFEYLLSLDNEEIKIMMVYLAGTPSCITDKLIVDDSLSVRLAFVFRQDVNPAYLFTVFQEQEIWEKAKQYYENQPESFEISDTAVFSRNVEKHRKNWESFKQFVIKEAELRGYPELPFNWAAKACNLEVTEVVFGR